MKQEHCTSRIGATCDNGMWDFSSTQELLVFWISSPSDADRHRSPLLLKALDGKQTRVPREVWGSDRGEIVDAVFWVWTACSLVGGYRCFDGAYFLYLQFL